MHRLKMCSYNALMGHVQTCVDCRQYKEEPDLYKKTARHWAHVYAGGEPTVDLTRPCLLQVCVFVRDACGFMVVGMFLLLLVSVAPSSSELADFDTKLKQLLNMGISEVRMCVTRGLMGQAGNNRLK